MCDAQVHRGPDDEGYYSQGSVCLGIRRLAIIDLRKGLYPLSNEDGRIRLVFNGEIYGFHALRKELEALGHRFRTDTDAEVVVHGYEEWGSKGCLGHLNGMFAFALWDERAGQLWIARDHFGIKPLYYHVERDFLTFASEIKPILSRHDVHVCPNEVVIHAFLESSRVDDREETFFQGIKQLRPGQQMFVALDGKVHVEQYWKPHISRQLDGIGYHNAQLDCDSSVKDEVALVRGLFLNAIQRQLVSDVSVGSCLSGGIDSSSIVCTVGLHSEGMKTVSAVFPGCSIDESAYARIVCTEADAHYNPVLFTADDLWSDLPELIRCQEEPFTSSSMYAQFRVMSRAKELGVKVMLDGQGGDELLCGYLPLYLRYLLDLSKHGKHWRLLVEGLRSYDILGPYVKPQVKSYMRRLMRPRVRSMIRLVLRGRRIKASHGNPGVSQSEDLPSVLAGLTSVHGLPALLRYEDKNAMWHSIETRVPFLDRPFFEYVASLPLDRKIRDGWTKWIFREAMRGILPEMIRRRRSKIGFETPEKNWLENDLRGRLQTFFSQPLVASRFYDLAKIKEILEKPNWTPIERSLLWRCLTLELWHQEFFRK